jgi:hypothetical protein
VTLAPACLIQNRLQQHNLSLQLRHMRTFGADGATQFLVIAL